MTGKRDPIRSVQPLTTETGMSEGVQRDKTLPAAVPSSAFSSFLTFWIVRIDSGMPGRELGGKKKRLCVSRVPPRVLRETHTKRNKMTDAG